MPWTALLSLLLAMLIGFAAHRASLCSVRAVAEAMGSGTSWILRSFLMAMAWAGAVGGAFALAGAADAPPMLQRLPAEAGLLGGFVFGVGAAVNGGCSLSTLQRLADGDLSMAWTLFAFVAGLLAMETADSLVAATALHPLPSFWRSGHVLVLPLLALAWLGLSFEVGRHWRLGSLLPNLAARILAPAYRLSSTAALMGIAAGLLYQIQGAWSYTGFLRREASAWVGAAAGASTLQLALVVAVLLGMFVSSWQRRSFVFAIQRHMWRRRMLGGLVMGAGAYLLAGGNDTLILFAIPAGSPWALADFLAMCAGIATVLFVMRRRTGAVPVIECSDDICG